MEAFINPILRKFATTVSLVLIESNNNNKTEHNLALQNIQVSHKRRRQAYTKQKHIHVKSDLIGFRTQSVWTRSYRTFVYNVNPSIYYG